MKTQELSPTKPSLTRHVSGGRYDFLGEQTTLINDQTDSMNLLVKARCIGSNGSSPSTQTRQHASTLPASHHWGIILAGGDGTRLRELTRWVCGDDRPKQFCPLLDRQTLFEATRQRAQKSLPADHIILTLTRTHEIYYRDLVNPLSTRRIIQPYNRGTAPAILYALMVIAQADPDAIVSILPSDHYYSPEAVFKTALESSFKIAGVYPGAVIVLGASPKGPEIEYGWVEVGQALDSSLGLFRVEHFLEKPTLPTAQRLYQSGSLWNMFVMVGHVRAFLDIASRTIPSLVQAFESDPPVRSSGAEIQVPDRLYDRIAPVDFSSRVLTHASDRLLALRLENLEWSDLGDPYRVLVTLLEKDGSLPAWAKLWPQAEEMRHAAAA